MDRATAVTHLDLWLAADKAVSTGQAYTIGEVTVTRVDAGRIRQQIAYWQSVIDSYDSAAQGGSSRVALASFGSVP